MRGSDHPVAQSDPGLGSNDPLVRARENRVLRFLARMTMRTEEIREAPVILESSSEEQAAPLENPARQTTPLDNLSHDEVDLLYSAGRYDEVIAKVQLSLETGPLELGHRAAQFARSCLETGNPDLLVASATRFHSRCWHHRGFRKQYFLALVSVDRIADARSFIKQSVISGLFDREILLRAIAEYRRLSDPPLVANLIDLVYRQWTDTPRRTRATFLQNILLNIGYEPAAIAGGIPLRTTRLPADGYFLLSNYSTLSGNYEDATQFFNCALAEFSLDPIAIREPRSPLSVYNVKSVSSHKKCFGPLVTVVVPSFNAQDTIISALTSLSSQTYQDLEIIVVDDCSTDETTTLVDRYARESDPRVRLLRMSSNGGPYRARNRALDEGRGVFFTCNDADDWSHHDKISLLVEGFADGGSHIAVQSQLVRLSPEVGVKPRRQGYVHADMSSTMFRREDVIKRVGFYEPVRFGADSEYAARLLLAFGSDAIKVIEKPLLLAHWSETTMTSARGTGISDGGILFPRRAAYKNEYRSRHARGDGIFLDRKSVGLG